MASTSSAIIPLEKHDVFLSFRGTDTRDNFVSFLHLELVRNGIETYVDNRLQGGDVIEPALLRKIEESLISVVILSAHYPDSTFCLRELSKILHCKETKGQIVIPVFYKVSPDDVGNLCGIFRDALLKHEEKYSLEEVSIWRQALEEIAKLKGWDSNVTKPDTKLTQEIVDDVKKKLKRMPLSGSPSSNSGRFVGITSRVKDIESMLSFESLSVFIVGILGMGGIGKSITAKAVYDRNYHRFDGHFFFLSDRKESQKYGQQEILREAFNKKDLNIQEDNSKRVLRRSKVLIVLDNVNSYWDLKDLVGEADLLGEGSRIIVTSRDRQVLVNKCEEDKIYEVKYLDKGDSLELFSLHAFHHKNPVEGYTELSKSVLSYVEGIPLVLEVLGSSLYKKSKEYWRSKVEELRKNRGDNFRSLEMCYDQLSWTEKKIFLDIACFFGRCNRNDVQRTLHLEERNGIDRLADMCLIKIVRNEIWMHDVVQQLGREIVLKEDNDPRKRSRLWEVEDILHILKHHQGTEKVEALSLDLFPTKKMNLYPLNMEDNLRLPKWPDKGINFADGHQCLETKDIQGIILDFEKKKYRKTPIEKFKMFLRQGAEDGEFILDTEALKSMVNLRLLQINHAKVEGKFKNFPAGLKWLQWKNCPLRNLPSDYAPHKLAVLDLSESGIERVWGWTSNKVAENLMVMNLRHCYNLVACPDLFGCKTLEKLDLEGCGRLAKIHESVGNLRTLLQLNLNDCLNLVAFPSDISGLRLLQNLNVSNCPKLKELPKDIGSMKSLKQLHVDKTAISVLPESIFRLTKLEKLSLNGCQFIKRLPNVLGHLISLKELSLNQSAVEELPDSVGSLSNLEKLSLMRCQSLTAIPETVGNLQLLTELELDGSPISDLPEQIGGLKMIEKLYMRKCTSLRSLPEAIGSILNLTTINLFGCNIMELPESFGRLENLVWLRLGLCKKLHKLPVSIGELKSLCHLLMEKTAVTVLPESFGKLSSLMILTMGKEPLESLSTHEQSVVLPASFSELSLLQELDAHAWRISGKILDDFEKLSSLEFLHLGYNNFSSLPSSLRGLSLLKKLYLPHCEQLESLPPLPSSLEEVDVSNCFALETISDVSNLGSLTLLNITNCDKVVDIPGIECLKSLKWLYMSNCKACSLKVKRRLSKVCLRNIRNLSIPGTKIPDWFSQEDVIYLDKRNREIKAVIIGVVVSLSRLIREDLRYSPVLPDILVNVLDQNRPIFSTTLYLKGIPNCHADQIHLCRYSHFDPFVLMLKDGFKIEVRKRNPPMIEGVELKKYGIHLVYEDDDDYGGNEESLEERHQSVSLKLANFFNSYAEDSQVCCSWKTKCGIYI